MRAHWNRGCAPLPLTQATAPTTRCCRGWALATLQLERRFSGEPNTLAAVGNGIASIAPTAESMGAVHPDVLASLGGLYADTISHLRPRIMVQGNPHYLGYTGVVSEIRALLLAAVRSAMLWRQLGAASGISCWPAAPWSKRSDGSCAEHERIGLAPVRS